MNQNNLWVFGDSFSVPFKKIEKECPYVHYKGYCPKIYSELLSEKLEYNLIDMSVGGCSNYSLFHKFIDCMEKIKPNDILIKATTSGTTSKPKVIEQIYFSVLNNDLRYIFFSR